MTKTHELQHFIKRHKDAPCIALIDDLVKTLSRLPNKEITGCGKSNKKSESMQDMSVRTGISDKRKNEGRSSRDSNKSSHSRTDKKHSGSRSTSEREVKGHESRKRSRDKETKRSNDDKHRRSCKSPDAKTSWDEKNRNLRNIHDKLYQASAVDKPHDNVKETSASSKSIENIVQNPDKGVQTQKAASETRSADQPLRAIAKEKVTQRDSSGSSRKKRNMKSVEPKNKENPDDDTKTKSAKTESPSKRKRVSRWDVDSTQKPKSTNDANQTASKASSKRTANPDTTSSDSTAAKLPRHYEPSFCLIQLDVSIALAKQPSTERSPVRRDLLRKCPVTIPISLVGQDSTSMWSSIHLAHLDPRAYSPFYKDCREQFELVENDNEKDKDNPNSVGQSQGKDACGQIIEPTLDERNNINPMVSDSVQKLVTDSWVPNNEQATQPYIDEFY